MYSLRHRGSVRLQPLGKVRFTPVTVDVRAGASAYTPFQTPRSGQDSHQLNMDLKVVPRLVQPLGQPLLHRGKVHRVRDDVIVVRDDLSIHRLREDLVRVLLLQPGDDVIHRGCRGGPLLLLGVLPAGFVGKIWVGKVGRTKGLTETTGGCPSAAGTASSSLKGGYSSCWDSCLQVWATPKGLCEGWSHMSAIGWNKSLRTCTAMGRDLVPLGRCRPKNCNATSPGRMTSPSHAVEIHWDRETHSRRCMQSGHRVEFYKFNFAS
jgi:hypothetical protein